MIPVRGYAGHKVAVLGLGRSGLPAVAALRAGGAEVIAWDDSAAARDKAEADGIALADLTRARSWDGVKAVVVSPGIPHLYPAPHPAVAAAWEAGVAVDNDIGLFFRSFATPEWGAFDRTPQVVAITGSNGKSTTTALTAHVLREAGRPVQVAGNIGRGVLDLDPATDGMVVVLLELSSYQIELARALQPDIAVFLNLSPDHLDRHGGIGGYFAAKRRLFTQGGPARAVIGVDEDEGRFLANVMREDAGGDPVIAVSVTRRPMCSEWSVSARKGFLSEYRGGRQLGSIDLRPMLTLPGSHNHQNACAAYAVARALGLGPRQIEAAFASYPGLPHRSQLIATWKGVRIVNDSKATNADAAARALASFERIRWIAGGRAKEGGIEALRPLFGRVAKAYLVGEAAEEFAATLGDTPHVVSGTVEAAVAAALAEAQEGEVVLLAPACASFDQFSDFEARGRAFETAVRRRIGAG